MVYSEGISSTANETLRTVAAKLDVLYTQIYELQTRIDAITPFFPNIVLIEQRMQAFIDHFNAVVASVDQTDQNSYYHKIEAVREPSEAMEIIDDFGDYYIKIDSSIKLTQELLFGNNVESLFYEDVDQNYISALYQNVGANFRNYTASTFITRMDALTEKTSTLEYDTGTSKFISQENIHFNQNIKFTIIPGSPYAVGINMAGGIFFNKNDIDEYNAVLFDPINIQISGFNWEKLAKPNAEVLFEGHITCPELTIANAAIPELRFVDPNTFAISTQYTAWTPSIIKSKLPPLEALLENFGTAGGFTHPSILVPTVTLIGGAKKIFCTELWVKEVVGQDYYPSSAYSTTSSHPITHKVALVNGKLVFAKELDLEGILVINQSIVFNSGESQTEAFNKNTLESFERLASNFSFSGGKTFLTGTLYARASDTSVYTTITPSITATGDAAKQYWGFNEHTLAYYYHEIIPLEFLHDPLDIQQNDNIGGYGGVYVTKLQWRGKSVAIPTGTFLLEGFIAIEWLGVSKTGDVHTTDDTTENEPVYRVDVQTMTTPGSPQFDTGTIVYMQRESPFRKTSKRITIPLTGIEVKIRHEHNSPIRMLLYTTSSEMENGDGHDQSAVVCNAQLRQISFSYT